ncbi:hypothetical protein SKAU_G00230980 [Synaphobranchus kaupii]|uniref:Uncharacterized protein n=1 Tax=Synaphobranchus kaupii TaxID=118154 RepID=A0A9Q1F5K3_SYNKA|nr:hypothetical protein SKAU_G00230980 [Synaphobranchus kaupii]
MRVGRQARRGETYFHRALRVCLESPAFKITQREHILHFQTFACSVRRIYFFPTIPLSEAKGTSSANHSSRSARTSCETTCCTDDNLDFPTIQPLASGPALALFPSSETLSQAAAELAHPFSLAPLLKWSLGSGSSSLP